MTFVTVHADGHIELQEGGARSHAYVRPIEATQIIDRLRGLEKQLETLRPLAEEYGCCDHEEVWAKTSTIEITLPVSYAQVIATTPKLVVEEHYPVPDDLYGVFSALESLVIRAFHRRPSFTLVPRGAG